MTKTRLAVCIGDEVYQNRFVKCLMNHYHNQFEVYIFTDAAEIQDLDAQEYEVIIIGDCSKEDLEHLLKHGKHLLYLKEKQEEVFSTEQVNFVDKYQEVFKIVDSIEKITGNVVQNVKEEEHSRQVIGVFSLSQEKFQLPFSAALCSICGEKKSVVLLDLQPFSGLASTEENWGNGGMDEILGMEDLMAVSTTGVYTKGRLLAGIGRKANFDYVHGVKNPECLAEGNVEIYTAMIDMLAEELGYDCVVINFGSVFAGMLELMNGCDECYFLTSKENSAGWREKAFREVLEKRGKEDFFRRVKRFEVPTVYGTDEDWQQLAEKWRWSQVGDILREELWERNGIKTE